MKCNEIQIYNFMLHLQTTKPKQHNILNRNKTLMHLQLRK